MSTDVSPRSLVEKNWKTILWQNQYNIVKLKNNNKKKKWDRNKHSLLGLFFLPLASSP